MVGPVLPPPVWGLLVWVAFQGLLLLAAILVPVSGAIAMVAALGLVGYLVLLGWNPFVSPMAWRQDRCEEPAGDSGGEHSATVGALRQRLESWLPQSSEFYRIRLRRRFWGWVCTVVSAIPSLPWQYQVYAWGRRPAIEKMARLLLGPLRWFTPQAKAHQLAEAILGREGMRRVLAGTFSLPSRLNPDVAYRFTPYSLVLFRKGRPLGSFCLQARGRYPLWDVVLSRMLMVAGSEPEFLRTAHFYGPVPPYFAVPMTRNQFGEIFGKEALDQWDACTFLTPARATRR